MNFLKNLFHKHRWETISSLDGNYQTFHVWGSQTIDALLVFQKCSGCSEEKAFLDTGWTVREYSVLHAKRLLKLQKLYIDNERKNGN